LFPPGNLPFFEFWIPNSAPSNSFLPPTLTKPVAVLTFGPFMHFLRFLLAGLAFLVASLAIVWTAGALYFDLPAPGPLRTLAAIAWALGAAALGIFGGGRGACH
jgi:hypothetical protein